MSKQSEAKNQQGYNPKPIQPVCMNCVHYESNIQEQKGPFSTWYREINILCGLGNFAIKKTATCNQYQQR